MLLFSSFFFFSSRRRHTRWPRDWSSDVCSSDLLNAVMPFHSWLPAAMVAPTPVSALLHAVAVVKTGVFSTVRVFLFVFGVEAIRHLGADKLALVVASVTILGASLLALGQDNLKARLAFSTISQLSYIVLGAALLTPSGILGGIAHITNHAVST